MRELKSPGVIIFKGVLFLVLGVLAGGMLIWEMPTWRVGLLLGVTVWALARAYYFAFYVIEHYVDGEFRYAGIGSAVRYLMGRGWTGRHGGTKRAKDAAEGTEGRRGTEGDGSHGRS